MRYSSILPLLSVMLVWSGICRAADTRPAGRELRLNVVRSDTGQTLEGVRGAYTVDGDKGQIFDFDPAGEFRVPLPEKVRQVRIDIYKDDFVHYSITFGEGPRVDPLPDHYTAHLLSGTVIGGIVRDEQGKGIEGVKVQFESFYALPDNPARSCNGVGVAHTDAEGRWTFAGAPDKPTMLMLSAQHPDFMLSSSHQNLRPAQFELLRKKSLVTVIRRGISVPGVVLDEQGKPIAGAKIGQDSLGLVNGVTSNELGKFLLRGVEPGKRQIMVNADGFALKVMAVQVSTNADAKPLEFRLEKGRALRGQVVDAAGHPVANAHISFIPFKELPRMNAYATTGADGRFVWNGAPDGPVTASVFKQGYVRLMNLTWSASGAEPKVVLAEAAAGDPFGRPTALKVSGSVVDDQTGQPVEKFHALVTVRKNAQPRMSRSSHAEGSQGRYEVPVSEAGDQYVVRIDSEKYLPLESAPLPHGPAIQFNARLKKGTPISGILLQPDGRPAVGADAALREWFMIPVEDGRIDTMRTSLPQVHLTRTGADGHFELPPRDSRVVVFAVHDSGWGEWVREGQGAAAEPLKLRPWSVLEGTLIEAGKPAVGKIIRLEPILSGPMPANRSEYPARTFFRYETTTDEQGHFIFDRVIDGLSRLMVEQGTEGNLRRVVEGLTASIDLKPGEHRTLRLGGTGRPIIGKLAIPDDLKGKVELPKSGRLELVRPAFIPPAGYENLAEEQKQKLRDAFKQSPGYQAYVSRPSGYGVTVNDDGTFRADDIPAGEYMLSFSVHGASPDASGVIPLLASARSIITVPEIPGGRSDEPLDVSKLEFEPWQSPSANRLEMKAFKDVKVGQPAPDFEALTYDGKKARLSDLRGEYVLLDFWATWCRPCIVEIKNLERLHEQWRSDPRLVMISISLDDRLQEPTRFLQNRKLPWLQWYGGGSGPQSGFEEFGIHAIPSVWIIAPDGKVLARDLYGEALPPALDKALAKKGVGSP